MKLVSGFAFDRSTGHLLLVKKTEPSWARGLLSGVDGPIEVEGIVWEEATTVAMSRIFLAKTGVEVKTRFWRLFCHITAVEESDDIYCFATLTDLSPAVQLTQEPIIRIDPTKPLPSNIVENLAWLIPMCRMKSRTYANVAEHRMEPLTK
jgi:hypothetical protein